MTKKILILMAGLLLSHNAGAQLTISFSTAAPGGKYAQRNVVAAWVETEGGAFVKTISRYGGSRANDMSVWKAASGGKSVDADAVMGATRPTHNAPATISATWDFTDRNGVPMPHGNYKIWFNIDDGSERNYSFPFIKDQNGGTRSDGGNSWFKNISLSYTPNDGNTAPVAEAQTVTVRDGAPVSFTLIATDADDDPITYNLVSTPSYGHLIGTPPELTYVPPQGLNGATLKFLFSVSDASNMGNSEYVSLALVFEDTSGNGIPDSWEATYGVTNATADSDHDGASNYQEYMAGTNPTNGTSVLAMNPPQLSGGSNVVLQWNSAEYKFYNIQSSTNLLNGWDTIGSTYMATPPVNSYTGIVNSAGSTYYRISLEP